MIRSFRDRGTEDIFDGSDTRVARRTCPRALWATVRRKLDQINRVRDLRDLATPPGNRLERLRGNRSGQHSIRVNEQYRVCFRPLTHPGEMLANTALRLARVLGISADFWLGLQVDWDL
ncbi:MAG: type II toxin-antitoxin system RelE/ParE family toxin [Candidatus Tectomicrobia bacterium]|uniref:Type II toxin-antitoxin system RelE/ParE family toxin n=1 Tax=Tectimicrobiota bacterium TaxID=2528274 RepID=A0A932GRR3_UNCTE|nr:type II toxin-antitoxin system RelE/ParE family toxin [Candidatus Tectomicrobia bacterium]